MFEDQDFEQNTYEEDQLDSFLEDVEEAPASSGNQRRLIIIGSIVGLLLLCCCCSLTLGGWFGGDFVIDLLGLGA